MNIYKFTQIFLAVVFAGSVFAMQRQAPPSLKNFDFGGASVLPFTKWPSKTENYVLLMREADGADRGTYDAMGGGRDKDYTKEPHPSFTGSREFAEETMYLLGKKRDINGYIQVDAPNTLNVIANQHKRFVVYLTKWDHQALEFLVNNFYQARAETIRKRNLEKDRRAKAKWDKLLEKDKLAWVKWSNLEAAIAFAERDPQTRRLKTPIKVWANVVEPDGTRHAEAIELRPILVSTLQSYFIDELSNQKNYVEGKNSKIRFYQQ